MAKRILALAITLLMIVGTFTVVSADVAMTLTANDFDATAVLDGKNVDVSLVIDAIPQAKIQMVQIYFDYDPTKLTFNSGRAAMQVWDIENEEPLAASWNAGAITSNSNTNGLTASANILFNDGNGGATSFTAESLAANSTLCKIRFKKVAGAAGDTTVDITEIKLVAMDASDTPTNYTLTGGTLAAVDATVSFGGEVEPEPAEVTWEKATDAGYYTQDGAVYGLMRFLFDVATEGVVTETGIKYVKGADLASGVAASSSTGTDKTFYGDVIAIPEGETDTYYAVAYAVVDGAERWSTPVACTPDFVKAVIK